MVMFFVLVAVVLILILVACILFFVYGIYTRSDAIEMIHFLSSENDKSVSEMNKNIKKINDFLFKYDVKD